ncbi:MAG: hypothetical protein ACTSR8_04805 [Promethearchaeota archaeon]
MKSFILLKLTLIMPFKIAVIGPLNIDLIMRGNAPKDIQELNT